MNAKPVILDNMAYIQVDPVKATHVKIKLPGPTGDMLLPVIINGPREETGKWSWNGDTEKPTLKPRLLVRSGHHAPSFDPKKGGCWCTYYKENPNDTPVFHCFICHSWINDGRVQFLPDSTHELRGKTVDLLDVP